MNNKYVIYGIFILIIIITLIGFPLDLMVPDAALYGTISKTIYENNDFVNLFVWEQDWLDKPHFPFWLSAISFNIFGFSNFSYKLPGVLLFFFSVYITYKFTKENYNKETAIIASIILLTSLHSVISNFDVRAEPFLTGLIIPSLYWFYKYIKNRKIVDLVIGSLFCACAIMTKGMFALIPIACAIGGEFIMKKQWKEIINPIWLLALVCILIFIIPEIYTLYIQFDAHPEKTIFNKNNVSGIRFFFWDSQFGRFFNTGPIKGKGDIFFFIHTLLWAFLPWSVLFYLATFFKIKRNFKSVQKKEEFYSLFASLSTIILFSLSKFQLAHYTNVIFPFMAIITADFIYKLKDQYSKLQKTYFISQWFVIGVALIAIPLISFIMLPKFNLWFLLIIALAIGLFYLTKVSKETKITKIFFYSAVTYGILYGFMMTHFYPTALQYQGDVSVAKYVNKHHNKEDIYCFYNNGKDHFGYTFYANTQPKVVTIKEASFLKNKLFFVHDIGLMSLNKNNIKYSIEQEFDQFKITKINGKFLNAKTRKETLKKKYLLRLH